MVICAGYLRYTSVHRGSFTVGDIEASKTKKGISDIGLAPVYSLVAFSAALVTKKVVGQRARQVWRKSLTLAILLGLLDGLDDTDGNGLPHISDGKTAKRRVLVVGLNTHGLAGDELDNARITRLDELGRLLNNLSASPVDLLNQFGKLAGNVDGVRIQDGGVTRADLTRVVENNDLGIEGSGLLGRVVLGVRGDVATADILHRDALDVETDVVTRLAGLKLFVVHFDRLHFSGNISWGEGDGHAGLDDTSLDTTDGHRPNTTNLVDILEGDTEWLVGRTDGRVDGIDGVHKGLTLDSAAPDLLCPALVPGHAGSDRSENLVHVCDQQGTHLADSSTRLSPCHPEMGTKATFLGS